MFERLIEKFKTPIDPSSTQYSMINFASDLVSTKNRKTAIILLYAVFALTTWKYVSLPTPRFAYCESGARVYGARLYASSLPSISESNKSTSNQFYNAEQSLRDGTLLLWIKESRKLWSAFLLMGVFPALIVKYGFREKLAAYGLSWGIAKRTIRHTLIFLPIMLVIGWLGGATKEFYEVYPFNPLAGTSWNALILHSVSYFFLYYLAWEFMFRGFVQSGLAPQLGIAPAVLIQILASVMLHYGHPFPEVVGCVFGGILWGCWAIRTRSIFAGWATHAALGIALDWSLILQTTP